MTLQQLKYAVTAAECGTISAAAEVRLCRCSGCSKALAIAELLDIIETYADTSVSV